MLTKFQLARYTLAKQEFKDQMDPTDFSRSFYVKPTGDVIGFSITRSNGKILEYDASSNQYRYLSQDMPSTFDLNGNEAILNLPPYDYRQSQTRDQELHETHAFPDPSTENLYTTLRILNQENKSNQITITLTMMSLYSCRLKDHELPIMASKAASMYNNSPHRFALSEITAAINELMINGLSGALLGNPSCEHYNGNTAKEALISADQESFEFLVALTATENRSNIYHGLARSNNSENKIAPILTYLNQAKQSSHTSPRKK